MTLRRAAIFAPIRTAVGKFGGALASIGAGELGAVAIKALVERTRIDSAQVDDVVFAQGYGNGEAPAVGRWSWLAADMPVEVPGYQLNRRCGSGTQAVIDAAMMVQTGASDMVVAGGVESMFNVEHYSTDIRKGVKAGTLTLHDRLTRGRVMSQPPVENQKACEVTLRHDRLLRRPGAPSNPTYTPIAALLIGFEPESFTALGEGSNLTHVWDVLDGGGLIKRGVTIRQTCMDKLFDSRWR